MKPFITMGNTVVVTANSTAPIGVQANANQSAIATKYRVFNPDANTAWVAYGVTGTEARTNAVIPTAATAAKSLGIATLTVAIVSAPPNCFWSAINAAGNNNVNVTPGDA